MNKFHLEVVVRRCSSVVQLIFIYRIIMTIIIISPHLASPSLSQYGRCTWHCKFGHSAINLGGVAHGWRVVQLK